MRFVFLLAIFFGGASLRGEKPVFLNDTRLKTQFRTHIVEAESGDLMTSGDELRAQLKQRKPVNLSNLPIAGNARELSPAEIYRLRMKSTLLLGNNYKCDKCDKWHVSIAGAVAITDDGVLATNYHVMASKTAAGFGAMTHDGRFFPVTEVLAANPVEDVALIRVAGDGLEPVPLGYADVGEAVNVVSHPDGHFFSLATGIVSRYALDHTPKQQRRMEITANYAKGSSGSPIFGPRGNLVGLVSSTRSIYYTVENRVQKNFQLVKKLCVPVDAISELIANEAAPD